MARRHLPIRNIGIIAHIDAGKTTLSERILYYCHREHRMGEVDLGTATLDWMPEEQKRGITITAAATTVLWRDHQIQLIDTPGHVDFTAEVERSLRVLDGAIGVFCGTAGVQAQSETVWRQADRHHVPRIAFVNKLDRVGADFLRVVAMIRERLRVNAIPLQLPIGREKSFVGVIDLLERKALRFDAESLGEKVLVGDVPGELEEEVELHRARLLEAVADLDDAFLEQYLQGEEPPPEVTRAVLRAATISGRLVPVLCGAAARNLGVQPLLDAICWYLPAPEDLPPIVGVDPVTHARVDRRPRPDEALAALAFKSAVDSHGDLVYLRLYSGRLQQGEPVEVLRTGRRERAQQIYLMHANHRENVPFAEAGAIVAVSGFHDVATGDTIAAPGKGLLLEPPRFPEAVVTRAVEPESAAEREGLLRVLGRLTREDPTLQVSEDRETGQLTVAGMGELHLEVLRERLAREFHLQVRVGAPRVAYRQTVRRPAQASGCFDRTIGGKDLYARVVVALAPSPDAVAPEVKCREGCEAPGSARVPREWIPQVADSLRAALSSAGPLGYPLVQISATILEIEARPGATTPAALSSAVSLALEAALEEAGLVLLEPILRFEIQVPDVCYGPVCADLERRRSRLETTDLSDGVRILSGVVPLAETFGYSTQLRILTQGRAGLSLEPCAYAEVPESAQARATGR